MRFKRERLALATEEIILKLEALDKRVKDSACFEIAKLVAQLNNGYIEELGRLTCLVEDPSLISALPEIIKEAPVEPWEN